MKEIKLMIVDDQLLFLNLLEESIKESLNIKIVKTFRSGEQLFHSLSSTDVDVILLDVEIPKKFGDDGFQIAERIKKNYPLVKIISMSVNTQSHILRRLIKTIGVDGFIDKNNSSLEELTSIIRLVDQGHFYIDAFLGKKARRILEIEQLSPREKQIVELIVSGMSNKEVADRLLLSHKTIDNHRQNIFLKLGCNKVSELAKQYYYYLLLQNDDDEFLPNFKRRIM